MKKTQSDFNTDGFHRETLEFAMYVLCRMKDIRPDQLARFGAELGLSAERQQWAFNSSLQEDWPDDEPLPIRLTAKGVA